jgi:hypothetical protein
VKSTAFGIIIGGCVTQRSPANVACAAVVSVRGVMLLAMWSSSLLPLSVLMRHRDETRTQKIVDFRQDDGPSLDLEWDDSLGRFVVIDENGEEIGTVELPD